MKKILRKKTKNKKQAAAFHKICGSFYVNFLKCKVEFIDIFGRVTYNLPEVKQVKFSKGFIISVYAGIAVLLVSPVLIISVLTAAKSDTLLFLPYIPVAVAAFAVTLVFGIKTALKARRLFERNETEKLQTMWLSVKLVCIPAYLINFVLCAAAGTLGLVLFPLNLIVIIIDSVYVFMCVVLSGFVGFYAIKSIKKADGKIHSVCSILQFIPFWDVVCTLIIKCTSL